MNRGRGGERMLERTRARESLIRGRAWRDKLIVLSVHNGRCPSSPPRHIPSRSVALSDAQSASVYFVNCANTRPDRLQSPRWKLQIGLRIRCRLRAADVCVGWFCVLNTGLGVINDERILMRGEDVATRDFLCYLRFDCFMFFGVVLLILLGVSTPQDGSRWVTPMRDVGTLRGSLIRKFFTRFLSYSIFCNTMIQNYTTCLTRFT